jgi:hypothetical protein
LIEYNTLPPRYKQALEAIYGKHDTGAKKYTFESYIETDAAAQAYYDEYTLASGEALPDKAVEEYVMNASILNTMYRVATDRIAMRRAKGGGTRDVWPVLCEVVAELDREKYPHTLPANQRRLKDKYNAYRKDGYCDC